MLAGCSTAAADSGFGIADALSDIVKSGIDKFLIGCADNLYEQSYRPDEEPVFNGTSTEIFIYSLTTNTVDPWSRPGIINFMKKTLLLVVIYSVFYLGIGLIYLLLCMLVPAGADIVDSILNRGSAFRTARIKEYFENILVSLAVIGFTNTAMQMLFALNFFLVSFFIVSCFDVKSLSPSSDNAILYLAIAVFYAVLAWFMSIRGLLLYIFVAISFLIGALFISNKTRELGFSIGYYFIGILFLQFVIVLLTTAGFVGVEAMCADAGFVAGSLGELVLYFLLLCILVWATLRIMFGLKRYKKTVIRLVM